MSKKYKEEINKIVMNDAMKKRILQNVLAAKENDNSVEKSMNVKTTMPKVKKYDNLKRNMQMAAACATILLCVSVAKNYPMLYKPAPNELKTSDDNKVAYNDDGKEIYNNNHKENQILDQNNYNNGNVKEESSASTKISQEDKGKDNSQGNSSLEAEKNQASQNNNDKVIENSNISLKTKPEEDINNKENKNPTGTEQKTTDENIMQNRIPENNADDSVSSTAVAAKEAVNYNQEYKTLEEAEKALNLKVSPLKTLPKGFKTESISVVSNEIIQVEYNDGNNNIIFRAGKDIDNISGDYNVYQVKYTVKVNGIDINLAGKENNQYNLASWESDGISYSISAENSIDEKTILDMVL